MPGGRALVCHAEGAGIMRRGRGRGAVTWWNLPPWRRAKVGELAAAVDEIEARDDWYDDPKLFARWLRGGGWGEIDGFPFDRTLLRSTIRRHGWRSVGVFALVGHNCGACLVLRGRRGARLLLMSGDRRVRCSGWAIVGGVSR